MIGLLTVHNRSVPAEQKARMAGCLAQRLWLGIGHSMSMTLLSQQLGHGPVLPVVGGFVLYPRCFFSPSPRSPHILLPQRPHTGSARTAVHRGGLAGPTLPIGIPSCVCFFLVLCRWSRSPAMDAPQRMAGWRLVLLLLTSIAQGGAYGWV